LPFQRMNRTIKPRDQTTRHGRFRPVGRCASIAAYAYTIDDGARDVEYASMSWVPRSGFKRALAAVWNPLVVAQQKMYESRTARREER
ncbi:MAG: hypothetical protein ABI898_02810, partial [Sphingomonadales bacterium]